MNILAWIFFGLLSGLVLHTIHGEKYGGRYLSSGVIGMLGAVTGGLFAFALFKGVTVGLTFPVGVILFLEAGLFMLLFSKHRLI